MRHATTFADVQDVLLFHLFHARDYRSLIILRLNLGLCAEIQKEFDLHRSTYFDRDQMPSSLVEATSIHQNRCAFCGEKRGAFKVVIDQEPRRPFQEGEHVCSVSWS